MDSFCYHAQSLIDSDRLEEARNFLEGLCNLSPDPHYLFHLCTVYEKQRHWDLAIDVAKQVLELDSDFFPAHLSLSRIYTMLGDKKGEEEFEYRFKLPSMQYYKKFFPCEKRWRGEDIDNKTVLVYGEQGYGDQVQTVRYVKFLKNLGAKVVWASNEIGDVLSQLVEVIPHAEAERSFKYDYHIPSFSLYKDLGFPEVKTPYLKSNKTLNLPKDYIGINWCGNPSLITDYRRSCPLKYFEGFKNIVSLQKNPNPKFHADIDLIKFNIDNFTDTLNLISSLSTIISVDSVVAHLAGALGIKTYLLLPYYSDCRWGLHTTTPLYSSINIIRQKSPGDWDSVFESLQGYINI